MSFFGVGDSAAHHDVAVVARPFPTDEVAAARDKLIEQAPLIKGFGTDEMRQSMIEGNEALAVIYSGDAFLCIDENPPPPRRRGRCPPR